MQTSRVHLLAWAQICVLVGIILIVYLSISYAAGDGEPLMPVDDAYIHFQYAKQIANGQPYIYNPGLLPTSGATSLLYPYLLAMGYLLGFQGLSLGLWAMLIGGFALIAAAWAVYQLVLLKTQQRFIAVIFAGIFVVSGAWHFMSGMETGLVVCFMLWTLYGFITQRLRVFITAATLLALMRPEGSLMAVMASVIYGFELLRQKDARKQLVWLLIPAAMIFVQPLLNFVLTHSFSASGNQAKSLLSLIPPDWNVISGRIIENFFTMWREFLIGNGAAGIWYLPVLLGTAGVIGVFLQRKSWRLILLLLAWMVIISAAISTLDTAFWHFKRYQMPLIALFYPLAAWVILEIRKQKPIGNGLSIFVIVIWTLFSGYSAVNFVRYYAQNTQSVAAQPLAMARWLAENTPQDAVIAVHDVGMMRYLGNRTTLDMVGLTTDGAADYWRNGPGSVGEFLSDHRPDYVAAYTTARGLNYLADTGVYGELLAGFETKYDPRYNVALGGEFQGIFKPDWTAVDAANQVLQPSTQNYLGDFELMDQIDVADLVSETQHDYHWSTGDSYQGFATEFYQHAYIDCLEICQVADGGRRINGEESFTINTRPGEDVILVTRVHPVETLQYDVYANGEKVAARWIPMQPGQWLEIATLIPAEFVTADQTAIRIIPAQDGYYMPYTHWVYQGEYANPSIDSPSVVYQDGAFGLTVSPLIVDEANHDLKLTIVWQTEGKAYGDYRVFVHVYDDVDQPPIAQAQDKRPGQGTLPPGNWLPGSFSDDFVVDLTNIPAGIYSVAIGLYDPVSEVRLLPEIRLEGVSVDASTNRLFLGQIEINR